MQVYVVSILIGSCYWLYCCFASFDSIHMSSFNTRITTPYLFDQVNSIQALLLLLLLLLVLSEQVFIAYILYKHYIISVYIILTMHRIVSLILRRRMEVVVGCRDRAMVDQKIYTHPALSSRPLRIACSSL